MKNLKKVEFLVICLTLMCLCFTAGYFVGRGSGAHVISVDTLSVPSPEDVAPKPGTGAEASPGAATAFPSAAAAATAASPESSSPAAPSLDNASPKGDEPLTAASGKININTASASELDGLPGVGKVIAGKIIAYREKIGGFKTIDQIKDIDGIGEKKFDAMKDMITVG